MAHPDDVQHWVERAIRDAEARGEFDDLPGHGKPIPDIDRPRDDLWWVKGLMRRERIRPPAPPAIELRKEVDAALTAALSATSESAVRLAVSELNARIARFNATATTGPASTVARLDPDVAVARWREQATGESA